MTPLPYLARLAAGLAVLSSEEPVAVALLPAVAKLVAHTLGAVVEPSADNEFPVSD